MGEQRPMDVRRAGVLLHVTSLPSGDLGPEAFAFVDFLAAAGVSVWQVLPLVPTHEEDRSPYNALSAMAGNPELISRARQVEQGLVDVAGLSSSQRAAYDQWCEQQSAWLDTYVEFMTLRDLLDHAKWPTWEPGLRDRDPGRVAEVLAPHRETLERLRFEQWVFAEQWRELKEYAARGVCSCSATCRSSSRTTARTCGRRATCSSSTPRVSRSTVTGVPPDYFAQDGQRWNNPHYDWDRMAADGFAWWRLRIARQRELFDLVRIDHFRGFEAAWHVPVEAETARDGYWVTSPGREVLAALVETAGPGTLVAEDLGVITPEVDALRTEFGLPGMKVLQFAFDGSPDNPYLPEHHGEQSVVYTGTHDNDTTVGWWTSLDEATREKVRISAARPRPSRCPGRWSGSRCPRRRGSPSYPPRTCSASAARRG